MSKTKKNPVMASSPEITFKKLTQLHRSRLYRVSMSKGLYIGQPGLLLALKQLGSCSQTDLAEVLDVTTPSIAVSVKRLEKSGMISKKMNESDNRYNRIALTADGQKSALLCEEIFESINTHMFDGFDDGERHLANQFFERMLLNLQNFNPDKEIVDQIRKQEKDT